MSSCLPTSGWTSQIDCQFEYGKPYLPLHTFKQESSIIAVEAAGQRLSQSRTRSSLVRCVERTNVVKIIQMV